MRDEIFQAIGGNDVTLVQGIPTPGQSTQLALLLADYLAMMDPTAEPPRIVCILASKLECLRVAHKAAAQKAEPVGRSVGYKVADSAAYSSQTSVIFTTVNIALQCLAKDPGFMNASHIYVDGVHERHLEVRFCF